jgi:CTP:molybdopterin cytidylyltransferase MocA
VLAVVLAAGSSSRFEGGSKLVASWRGRAVLAHALDAVLASAWDATAVVVGADPDVRALVAAHRPAVEVLVNHRPDGGLASSLAVAVGHARVAGFDAVVVGLGDQPQLSPAAWRAVAETVTEDRPIVFATYGGRRGHPVALAARVWSDLPETGEAGARALARLRPDLVGEVPCPGNPVDIDTTEDLSRWR